jgi:co-chaperonin GroES (HSP10)
VGEGLGGDPEVVGDEVALGQPALGEEQLLGVRDRDLVAADAHTRIMQPAGGIRRLGRRREDRSRPSPWSHASDRNPSASALGLTLEDAWGLGRAQPVEACTRGRRDTLFEVIDPLSQLDVTLEPLDDYLVVQPLEESETASGLIVPINEAAQCATGIVAAVGPDVGSVEPGDKVLYPRDAGYEVRLVRTSHRVRVLKREELIARIHD